VKPFTSNELMARVESRLQTALMRRQPVQSLARENTALEERVNQYTTQLENYNRELNEKNAKLGALNNELSGLTFAASHDLREPLRKIGLFTQRLIKEEEKNLSPNGLLHFKRVLTAVQTMSDLVADITLYANFKDSVGRVERIDLNAMLVSLSESLAPMMQEKNATLKYFVAEGLVGNPDQVKQVIYNLISNALKFGKPDVPLQITVTGRITDNNKLLVKEAVDKTKTYYQLVVTDNGIGIEPPYIKQIFDLFRKLHHGSMYPGTGIGLTVVRRIMENHNGFVGVESTPGEGSSFYCIFPIDADT